MVNQKVRKQQQQKKKIKCAVVLLTEVWLIERLLVHIWDKQMHICPYVLYVCLQRVSMQLRGNS